MSEVRVSPSSGAVTYTVIDHTLHSEFSRIRDDLTGQAGVRFGYTGFMEDGIDFNFKGLAKWDMEAKKLAAKIRYPNGVVGGEPVFIPHGGLGSDDGYVATILVDDQRRAELALYDAKTFARTPAVRMKLPVRVPHGFHGTWIDEKALQQHVSLTKVRK